MGKKILKKGKRWFAMALTMAVVTAFITPEWITDSVKAMVAPEESIGTTVSADTVYGENIAIGKDTKASEVRKVWWMEISADESNWKEKVEELFANGYPTDEEGNLLTDKNQIFLENGQLYYEKGKKVYDRRSSVPQNAVDGVLDDKSWHTNTVDVNQESIAQWMYVDLGKEYEIGRVILNWQKPAKSYRIEVSEDAVEWTAVYAKHNEYMLEKNIPVYAKGRYVRLYCSAPWSSGDGVELKEFQIFEYREGEEKKTYEIEKEPEIETVQAENSNGTYAMNDITFPMARPPVYMDESLQMPNQPVESNGWWQSIATQQLGTNLILLPLRTIYNIYGLNITETNEFWVNDHETGTLGEALTNQGVDFTLTPEGMDTSRVYDQVIGYSDYAVTTQLCDANGPVMTNTFVKGCPYLFAEVKKGQVVSISSYNITGIYDENGEILTEYNDEIVTDHFGLEITDDDNKQKTKTSVSQFCINLPENTRLKKSGNRIEIHFNGQETYLSVGAMTKREELATFYQHGYAFVKDTSVTYEFDADTSEVKTYFKVETELKREGFQKDTIQCLLPHQYKKSDAPVMEELSYVSARGTLKAMIGNAFETTDTFYGMVPQFTTPQDDSYSQELMTNYLEQMATYMPAKEQLMNTDAYWQGKGLHTLAMAVLIADQTGNYEYRDKFTECMHYIFEDWFTYSGGDDKTYLYYDDNWGTLYYKYSGYGANVGITDHHFTYGYFVFAAAVLATYDDAFYEKYKTMVDYLVRDYASPYEEDSMFCKFRTFDLYEGHSWAGGYADNDSGNNQESSSEALFGWVGMYLWAVRSGNATFKEAAIFGFTTEINAVEQYWFDYDGDNWPEDWPHNTVGQVYGSGIYYYTFFDDNTTSLYGIQWLPVAEWITHYAMGENKAKLQKMYEGFLYEVEQQKVHADEYTTPYVETPLTTWQHVFVPVRSLYDADAALEDYWKVCNGEVKNDGGNVAAFDYNEQINAYWFAHNMRDLGSKTDEIYALDGVPASVYKNGEKYTAIVWNPTKTDMKVRFTDAEKIVGTAVISPLSLVRLDPEKVKDDIGDLGETDSDGGTGSEGGNGTEEGAGSEGENGSEGETGIEGENGSEGETGTEGGAGSEGGTGTEGGAGSEGGNGTEGGAGSEGETGTANGTVSEGETGTESGSGSEGGSGTEGGAGSEGETGTESGAGSEGGHGTESGTGNEGENGSEGKTEPEGGVGNESEDGSESENGNKGESGDEVENGNEGDAGNKSGNEDGSDNGDKKEVGNEGGDDNGDKEESGNVSESINGNKGDTDNKDGAGNKGDSGNETLQTVSKVEIAVAERPYGVKSLSVKTKEKIVLKAIVEGSGDVSRSVIWTTSNKKILSVNKKGKVKVGTKTGIVTITATSVADSTKKAVLRIKVVKKAFPNKVLKLKTNKLNLNVKGQQAIIYLKKYTKNTTDKLKYKVISGKKYVTVNKYGVVKSKVNAGTKVLSAKVQVTYGRKKAIIVVAIQK